MLHFVGFFSAANTGCSGFAYAMARFFAVAGWLAPWRTGMRHGCITLVCIIYDKCTISKQQSQYVKFLCVDNCFLEMITQFFSFIYIYLQSLPQFTFTTFSQPEKHSCKVMYTWTRLITE